MAEDSSRETEDMKVHRHQTTSESFGGPAVTTAVAAPALNFSPHLLTSSSLGTGPNHFLRAGIVQGAQRTLGNRAVQRYLSVQRCGDSPCGCPEEEKARHALQHRLEVITETPLARSNDGPSAQRTFSVQRQPGHAPADPNYTGTTPGDAYVGPGNGAGIGGLVSYGCYCGPGGDAKTGSRCGPGAPPKDAIDATCMRHDSDYGKAGVDSGSAP